MDTKTREDKPQFFVALFWFTVSYLRKSAACPP
jgi:hypothetical protein